MTCPECGTAFTRSHGLQKFCSKRCTQRCAKRAWRAATRIRREPVILACVWCREIYEKSGPHQKYCSRLCAGRAWSAANPEKRKTVTFSCPQCGITVQRTRRRSFCSPLCANRAQQTANREKAHACPNCSTPFVKYSPRQQFCSPLCRQRAYRAANRRQPEPVTLACSECGTLFTRRTNKKYCSQLCATVAWNAVNGESRREWNRAYRAEHREKRRELTREWRAANTERVREKNREWRAANPGRVREMRRAVNRRRGLAKIGVPTERFTDREIYEREDWRCGICSTRVDPALKWPDQMSASLDHIIPLSRGGHHTRVNVQLAHVLCNRMKGNRILPNGEQLRLVG